MTTKRTFTPRELIGENRPTLWMAPLLAVVTLFYLYPAFEVLRFSITNASLQSPDYEYTLRTLLQRFTGRVHRVAPGSGDLCGRPRQRDPVRRAGLQAAGRHAGRRPGPDAGAVAGNHHPRPGRRLHHRRLRPAAVQVAGPQL